MWPFNSEKKQKKLELVKKYQDELAKNLTETLKKERAEIKEKACPFLNMSNCNSSCIHYDEGYARVIAHNTKTEVQYSKPRCKLW